MKKINIQKKTEEKPLNFVFGKFNYKLIIVGLAFIVLGFIFMIGGGTKNPNEFSESLFDFQRLTLAPILLIIGYIIEIVAIMYSPKENKQNQ